MPSMTSSGTVLICTFNRAPLLEKTLESLCRTQTGRRWDVIVVDNNSSDETPSVVWRFSQTSPVPVTYAFEPRQGKSHALNSGIARATGDVVVLTDDDVEVDPSWFDRACEALDEDESIDYTGGPVRPIWESAPPDWLDRTRGDLWGTLAILDYGAEPFVFEERQRVPLGVNMAVRRNLVDRIGGFHPELGRRGQSLMGQEQAEFLARARARGIRGRYLPGMAVAHHVPSSRMTRRYFRRWWFWKGVSRARVDAIHGRTELGLDLGNVRYLAGAPRYMWGQIVRETARWLVARLRGDQLVAMRHAMLAMYAVGYVRACLGRDRLAPVVPVPAPVDPTPISGKA